MKTKRKNSPLKFSPDFGPKLDEDQKKGLDSDLPGFVLKLSAQITKGGGACRNFSYYSMLIILYWRPTGWGPWHHAPPKYAPEQTSVYLLFGYSFHKLNVVFFSVY